MKLFKSQHEEYYSEEERKQDEQEKLNAFNYVYMTAYTRDFLFSVGVNTNSFGK